MTSSFSIYIDYQKKRTMKKILMSAVVATTIFASCTNEELVNQTTDGRMITLEVNRGMDSRTTLIPTAEGYQTLWSEGDKIYVTSEDGKTTGVLTLASKAGSANGTFKGFVFGEGELKYSVFPVPANGLINLNNPDEGQMDLPMVATINDDNTAFFKNACAIINLEIDGLPKNAKVSVSGADVVASATFNAKSGKLEADKTATASVSVKASEQEFLVPVFIKSGTTVTDTELNISVNGATYVMEDVDLQTEKVSVSSVAKLIYSVSTDGAGKEIVSLGKQLDGNDPNIESEDILNALSEGTSVVITKETASTDNTYTIGASTSPTVITFDYAISGIEIKAAEGEAAPKQPVKVIIAGGVEQQLEADDIQIDPTLNAELVYQVGSSEQLPKLLPSLTDKNSANTSVEIETDIDLSGKEWTPVSVDGYHGADIITIDGKGHTITGLSAPLFKGGFAGGCGIVIKNLTIADSEIVSTNTSGSGAFIESMDSMEKIYLENCHLLNSSVVGGEGSRTGGLIGWTAGYSNVNDGPVKTQVNIENCSVIDCSITSNGSVGGLYGHAGNNDWTYSTVTNCTVKDCTLSSTDDGNWRVGVVVGTANVGEMTISNITESGNILTQTGKTAPAGQSNLYGRFVPGTTGKLTNDGVEIK